MQINQHNYEAFFLMYADNELSGQEREMVHVFVKQNPDLAGELESLCQTVLKADEAQVFENKERLTKTEIEEEDLLSYLDGEAGPELTGKIERLAADSSDLKIKLSDLSQLYLEPDLSVQYPARHKLYKGGLVKRLDWRKLAVAASLLLCIGTWITVNKPTGDEIDVAPRVAINNPTTNQETNVEDSAVDAAIDDSVTSAPRPNFNSAYREKGSNERKTAATPDNSVAAQFPKPERNIPKEVPPPKARTTITAGENGGLQTQTEPSEAATQVPLGAEKMPATGATPMVEAARAPVKEKKSLFKKIGKQIGDRALDILSDGSDNINVAGFAIHVKK